MRLWIARHFLEPYRVLFQRRREKIDAWKGLLGDFSFFERIWWHHLYWFLRFLKYVVGSNARLAYLVCAEHYCRIADRILGGDRHTRFLEAREREIGEQEKRLRELEKVLQGQREERFALRLLREAPRNPNFIPPTKRIQ